MAAIGVVAALRGREFPQARILTVVRVPGRQDPRSAIFPGVPEAHDNDDFALDFVAEFIVADEQAAHLARSEVRHAVHRGGDCAATAAPAPPAGTALRVPRPDGSPEPGTRRAVQDRTVPQRSGEPVSAGLRDWQLALGSEAVGPGLHRLVIDQVTGIHVSQAFQRKPSTSLGTGGIPGIGLTGEPTLPLRLGLSAGGGSVVAGAVGRIHGVRSSPGGESVPARRLPPFPPSLP